MTGYADKEALFFCFATDVEFFHWRVNGIDIERLTREMKSDLTTEYSKHGIVHISTLFIKARIEYNGTKVQCGVDGLLLSKIATLTIQGMH